MLSKRSDEAVNRGFVLTRQWRDQGEGQCLIFWLATDDGPVKIEVTNQESVLFLRESELKLARSALPVDLSWRHARLSLNCFSESPEPAIACYFRNQRDLGFARARLKERGLTPFESDIRPTDRFLMERFVRGTLAFSGEPRVAPGYSVFDNPRIGAAEFDPELSVVSLDIETSVSRGVLLSIAIYGHDLQKVFMVGDAEATDLDYLEFVATEKLLLIRFLDWFAALDPDIVIGWHVVGFDLKYLQDRCTALGVEFTLGRANEQVHWRSLELGPQRLVALVPGRVVLDGIELLRTATYSFESFSLENVARELLGRGKLIHDVDARAQEIETLYESDKAALARYNLEDCALVLDIFEHTELLAFAIQRSKLTGLELDRAGGSVAAFDFLYLPKLHRAGFVSPVVDEQSVTHSPGGYVLDSTPGLYRDVIVLDFKSLYPSIIRTFHVDPLAMITSRQDGIPGYLGASFSRSRAILPRIIEELWAARDAAKLANDKAGSQAIKIIMNSFYGVLGTPGCRFFDPRLASSITMRGHDILKTTRSLIEQKGFPVIYGDTDSVFVHMETVDDTVDAAGKDLARYLNQWWRQHLNEEFGIQSFLEIEFETNFARFFMPTIRGSEKGSKKRYAGLIERSPSPELIFKGLETVRSDWSQLAREFQQALYRRLFTDEDYLPFIKQTVARVVAGELDDKLTLRRRIRRKLADYTKNLPPHVRAARRLESHRRERGLPELFNGGGWIEYVMTLNGPEPLGYVESAIDYQFYIERQIGPVADAILSLEGKTMAQITDKQMGLF